MREIRVSPDGNSVAIRNDDDDNSPMAWISAKAGKGGVWLYTAQVEGWTVLVP